MTNSLKTPRMNKNMHVAYVLGIFAVTAFGATLPVTRIALEGFSPQFITFARALFATLLAAAGLLWFRRPFFAPQWLALMIAGFFLIFTFPGFMAIAMETVPASHGGVVLGFLPLATALIARLIADERPSASFWSLSLAGCAVVTAYIFSRTGLSLSADALSGYLWLVLAGLTAACGYVIFGKLSRTSPGWEVISRALILNLPFSLAGLWWSTGFTLPSAGMNAWTALLYLGAFSMFLAFCAWNAALARGGIARIGQLQLLQIFVTLGVSAVLIGEHLDWVTLAAALAITGIIAASRNH